MVHIENKEIYILIYTHAVNRIANRVAVCRAVPLPSPLKSPQNFVGNYRYNMTQLARLRSKSRESFSFERIIFFWKFVLTAIRHVCFGHALRRYVLELCVAWFCNRPACVSRCLVKWRVLGNSDTTAKIVILAVFKFLIFRLKLLNGVFSTTCISEAGESVQVKVSFPCTLTEVFAAALITVW